MPEPSTPAATYEPPASSLHVIQFPNEISQERLAAAFDALGIRMDTCRKLVLTPDGYTAEIHVTNLLGQFVGFVEVEVPGFPGRTSEAAR